MYQDPDPNSIQIPLRVTDGSPSGESPFTRLAVVFYSRRLQPSASRGLSFSLQIGNGSNEELKVQSPLETLQLSLLNGKGWPVRLPPSTPPRTLINYRGHLQVIRPYQVLEIKEVGSGKDLLSIAEDLIWTLPAGGTLNIGIKIDRIVLGDPVDPTRQAVPVPIPKDAYKLKLIVLLISASGERAHRVFNMDYVGLKLDVD